MTVAMIRYAAAVALSIAGFTLPMTVALAQSVAPEQTHAVSRDVESRGIVRARPTGAAPERDSSVPGNVLDDNPREGGSTPPLVTCDNPAAVDEIPARCRKWAEIALIPPLHAVSLSASQSPLRRS
jgi:hypothetical protein